MSDEKPATQIISKLVEVENFNCDQNMKALGNATEVLDSFYELVYVFGSLLQRPIKKKGGLTFTVQMNLYQLMRQDILKAFSSLFRGYIGDSTFHSRRVIETAAMIIEMFNDEKKVALWTDLSDEAAVDTYVSNFMVYKLVKANLSKDVVSQYKMLCLTVHPSSLAVSQRAEITDVKHRLNFFDIAAPENDLPRLKRHLLGFLNLLLKTFKDIANSLEANEHFDYASWQMACSVHEKVWLRHATEINPNADISKTKIQLTKFETKD